MNIYTQHFAAQCPVNGSSIDYTLVIMSRRMIKVEEIQKQVAELDCGFHEDFAEVLFERFGGQQYLSAHHHGTDIMTVRP